MYFNKQSYKNFKFYADIALKDYLGAKIQLTSVMPQKISTTVYIVCINYLTFCSALKVFSHDCKGHCCPVSWQVLYGVGQNVQHCNKCLQVPMQRPKIQLKSKYTYGCFLFDEWSQMLKINQCFALHFIPRTEICVCL